MWWEGYPQYWRTGEESPQLQQIFRNPEQTSWLYTSFCSMPFATCPVDLVKHSNRMCFVERKLADITSYLFDFYFISYNICV